MTALLLLALATTSTYNNVVAGPKASCRWEPREEIWCEVTAWGDGTPTWEVRDSLTGELLHRTRSTAARLVLSSTRWRDVSVHTERGTPEPFRLRWSPRGIRPRD